MVFRCFDIFNLLYFNVHVVKQKSNLAIYIVFCPTLQMILILILEILCMFEKKDHLFYDWLKLSYSREKSSYVAFHISLFGCEYWTKQNKLHAI